eukprot:TRINITY_DN14261_c0_g1_i1.p1 TRINITY_DN14261_c0_g1~~TRINITY_DN14261_c0_g1_i1.p1  ORF type:complete len:117 (+),score=9.52 TRINITY_DN14261_c0_g1_i1:209-559(+)
MFQGGAPGGSSGPEVVSYSQLQAIVAQNPKVVVDVFTDWCGPCKMIAPHFASLAGQYPDIKFLKINLDHNRDLSSTGMIAGVPTFIFYHRGRVMTYFSGANMQRIQQTVQQLRQTQ